MRRGKWVVLFAGLMLLSAIPSWSTLSVGTNLFGRGRFRFSAYGGVGSALNQTYTLLGLGAGYFLVNGLEVGVDGEAWVGNDPGIYKITLQVRYVFYRAGRLMPYVGAFYRRTIYDNLSDINSYGGRAGFFSPLGGRGYAGFGIVYEKMASCDDNVYSSCSSTYPEVSISVGF